MKKCGIKYRKVGQTVSKYCTENFAFYPLHCKKRLAVFPFPAGMSPTKLSLAGRLVGDIPAGNEKTAKLFYSVLSRVED